MRPGASSHSGPLAGLAKIQRCDDGLDLRLIRKRLSASQAGVKVKESMRYVPVSVMHRSCRVYDGGRGDKAGFVISLIVM